MQGKWATFSDDLLKLVSTLYTNTNFPQLKTYLKEFKHEFLFDKMYTVMMKYRKVESGLLQTLLHQKCGFIPEGLSSACDWESLEMVYGDFFEIYANLLVVPTVLNNLSVRGDYQNFNSPDFTLAKYLASDKSGRSENFKTNNILNSLSDFYDSSIRNGTHHKASSFDNNNQTITLRTGKGGKTQKNMSLVNYIEHCNEIYARILIVLRSYYFIIQLTP
ncbi:hypothetical protein [Pedobacter sp. N23S346]|uniref:hypothetical protein n=1 Tax=Pedobacter sp. N23S346 TaxID=3402750 RepID=UPI003ACF6D86